MVDFWTYGCINCVHTLPHVCSGTKSTGSAGLVVVGVHTPEFANEHDTNNVRQAIGATASATRVARTNKSRLERLAQPLLAHRVLADRSGELVYSHVGEGAYDEIERTIKRLLG